MRKSSKTEEQRWEEFIFYSPDGCWYWLGATNCKGYGVFFVYPKQQLAHRISYQKYKGKISNGLWVLHSCDNPGCVNPNHLYLGTHQDNMDDMVAKGRHRDVSGEKNFNSKLTTDDVLLIRQLHTQESLRKLAKRFNIAKSAIFNIVHYKRWIK